MSGLLAAALLTIGGVGVLGRRTPPTFDSSGRALPALQHEEADRPTRMAGVDLQDTTGAQVQLDQGIWSACSLPSSGLRFSTNQDSMNNVERLGMESLVGCLRDGALSGRKVELVGHTGDPGMQGEGFKRANALGQFLKSNGLYPEQVIVASIVDEPGVPSPSPSLSRRVDVNLLP